VNSTTKDNDTEQLLSDTNIDPSHIKPFPTIEATFTDSLDLTDIFILYRFNRRQGSELFYQPRFSGTCTDEV